MILESIIDNLQAEGLLQSVPRTHVVLAYSGGADSTALLYLLNEIKQKIPLDVTAAYFNHRWRGNPPAELPMLHRNCLQCKTPLVIVQADLTLPKTESAARKARYRQLSHLAQDLQADAILTGHHADDQIETLLFRLMRGTGVDGLVGIQKRLILSEEAGSPVPILRPMLDLARKTIREYVQEHQLAYFEDPSNQDFRYQRNKIRNEILPVLEQAFPQVKNSLFRLSLVAQGDLHIIEDSIQAVWQQVYEEDRQGPCLNAVRFNQLGLPYQRRILKQFLNRQHIFPDFQTIEELLLFIQGEGRRQMDSSLKSLVHAPDGTSRFLSLYKDRLRLIPGPPAVKPERAPVSVRVPGVQVMPEHNLTFKALPWEAPEKIRFSPIRPTDSQQVFVNLSAFKDKPLELRNRRPGDKFQPMGMETPLRFKKFLINRGVPRFERDSLWVLAHGNQILWAPGLGISQALRVKPKGLPTHLLKLVPGLHPEMEVLTPIPSSDEDNDEEDIEDESDDETPEAFDEEPDEQEQPTGATRP